MRRSEWDELALDKLTRVLGRQQGERILQRTLSALGRPSLASEQDLYTFGQLVVAEEGFAGAVGASRKIAPRAAVSAEPDICSMSSIFVPTLPTCGKVKATIWAM